MTREDVNLPPALEDLESLLLGAGVRILRSEVTHLAAVRLADGEVELHVTDRFFAEPETVQREIILHELAHLIRGDLVIAEQVGAFQNETARRAFNEASDALINEALPALFRDGRFYSYSLLKSRHPTLPAHLPETVWLYRFLLRAQQNNNNGANNAEGNGGSNREDGDRGSGPGVPDDLLTPIGDADTNAAGWAATVARLTRTALERGVQLPEAVGTDPTASGGTGAGTVPSTGAITITPEAVALGTIRRTIERTIERVRPRAGGDTTRDVRTYRRLRNGLPMYLSRPAVRVAVLLDVSGTMMEYYGRVVYVARKLAREYHVEVLAWADRCERLRPPYDRATTFGGGTLLAPAVEEARRLRPDVIIIITDDDLHDREAAYAALDRFPAEVLWVVVPPGPCDSAPRRGRVVRWEGR